ncbi:MAG: DUF2807 domain-containing protein [Bacteroidetes bacterium]|nr:MAG: DUF2807 domain-containing protein [Bacteroidota bacterium]
MRKKSGTLLFLAVGFPALFHLSCNKENRWDCIKRTGKVATESRTISPFTKIRVRGNVDVFIKQGTTQEVSIEAGNNLIPLIKTEVDSGILEIDNKNLCNWARSYKRGNINVYITMPTLRFLWNLGSGLVKSDDTITCDTLDIWAHQSGDVDLTVNASVIYTNMHTTADLTLHGKTNILGSWHVGEGYLHCEELQTEIAWVHSKSSGNDHVNVQTDLAATIDWEGNIYYAGNPAILLKGVGTGKLIKQN